MKLVVALFLVVSPLVRSSPLQGADGLSRKLVKRGLVEESDVCSLEKDPGPCFGSMTKFYFNQATNECEQFIYGGCQGNANNFESLEDCVSNCATEAAAPVIPCPLHACTEENMGCPPQVSLKTNANGCKLCKCDLCNPDGEPITTLPQPIIGACSHFYQCSNGQQATFACPTGLVFNPSAHVCDWPVNVVGCNQQGGTTGNCNVKERETSGPKPIEGNCNQFRMCSDGVEHNMNCPENLVFNPVKLVCDYLENVPQCQNPTTTKAPEIPCPFHACTATTLGCPNGLKTNERGCELCECADGGYSVLA